MILHKDGSPCPEDSYFVFGSNRAGHHGAGAALYAAQRLGAEYGKGEGITGRCYAIPTKDKNIRTLPLHEIYESVKLFVLYVKNHPDMKFFITRVGCVLAGYSDRQIAPMFSEIANFENCSFPEDWAPYLGLPIDIPESDDFNDWWNEFQEDYPEVYDIVAEEPDIVNLKQILAAAFEAGNSRGAKKAYEYNDYHYNETAADGVKKFILGDE